MDIFELNLTGSSSDKKKICIIMINSLEISLKIMENTKVNEKTLTETYYLMLNIKQNDKITKEYLKNQYVVISNTAHEILPSGSSFMKELPNAYKKICDDLGFSYR